VRAARARWHLRATCTLLVGAALLYFGAAQTVAALLQIRATNGLSSLAGPASASRAEAVRAARADLELADRWWREPSNSMTLAALDLGVPPPFLNARGSTDLIEAARAVLERSLTEAPGSAAAWFWLAEVRLRAEGPGPTAGEALLMSIARARFDPALLAWRCQSGLELYRSLSDAGREEVADQIRLLERISTDTLIRVARGSGMMAIVVAALNRDRSALARFESHMRWVK
jgi:hypothetical protein